MNSRFLLGPVVVLAVAAATGAASAADSGPAPAAAPATAELTAPAAPPTLGAAIDPDQLDGMSGGQSTTMVITNQNLNAVNSGNSVTGETIQSGQVTLGQDAFAGFNGIGNFVINTGHNNNLQGSLSVSVAMTPTE